MNKEADKKINSINQVKEGRLSSPAVKRKEGASLQKSQKPTLSIEVMDHKIPERGHFWYVAFALISLGIISVNIYFQDWTLLFFVTVFTIFTFWRGAHSAKMVLEISDEGVKINERHFLYEQIDSWCFSRIGNNPAITIQLVKKYLPNLTFIFMDSKYLGQVRDRLGRHVPETGPREENIVDLILRKLKF